MSAPDRRDNEVDVKQMAGAWELSERQARRKLLEIGQRYPGTVRRGPKGQIWATREGVAASGRATIEPRVVVDARRLRERVKELEGRMDARAQEDIAFRKLAHSWFTRIAALEAKR